MEKFRIKLKTSFFGKVFSLGLIGLAISTVFAGLFGKMMLLTTARNIYWIISGSIILSSIVESLFLPYIERSVSFETCLLWYFLYILLTGLSYSFFYIIGVVFGFQIIYSALFCTLIVFGFSAFYGYFNKDLSIWASFLYIFATSVMFLGLLMTIFFFYLPVLFDTFNLFFCIVMIVLGSCMVAYNINAIKNNSSCYNSDENISALIGARILISQFMLIFSYMLRILVYLNKGKK